MYEGKDGAGKRQRRMPFCILRTPDRALSGLHHCLGCSWGPVLVVDFEKVTFRKNHSLRERTDYPSAQSSDNSGMIISWFATDLASRSAFKSVAARCRSPLPHNVRCPSAFISAITRLTIPYLVIQDASESPPVVGICPSPFLHRVESFQELPADLSIARSRNEIVSLMAFEELMWSRATFRGESDRAERDPFGNGRASN